MSYRYSVVERYGSIEHEAKPKLGLTIGNPIPITTILTGVFGSIIGGLVSYFIWRGGSAIVGGIERASPMIGMVISMLAIAIAMVPVFMLLTMFMNMMRAFA